jgi:hypothetical protein
VKFSRLLKESRLFWPSEVDISDGVIQEGGKASFGNLSEVWNKAEESQSRINEWHTLMSWAVFCGFHRAAQERLSNGDLSPLKFSDIDRHYVALKVSESLKMVYPSYPKQMRSQYRYGGVAQ